VNHTVLTGSYEDWVGSWRPSELQAGQTLREPAPLFAKLDPTTVIEEELARMTVAGENGDSGAVDST
jgi:hypothetical protein